MVSLILTCVYENYLQLILCILSSDKEKPPYIGQWYNNILVVSIYLVTLYSINNS